MSKDNQMKANNPTPTTLRALLSEIVDEAYAIMDSKSFADPYAKGIKQLEEQLKALLPEKKPKQLRSKPRTNTDYVMYPGDSGFNQAIDQIQKAIEEWAK